jgi:4-hydroxy-4-methyl-2-oxoglutarate aldolase
MAINFHDLNIIRQQLYVAAVCDILDELGYRSQVMHQRLRPLLPDIKNCGFIGRARTLRWMETDHVSEDPYGLEIAFMDSLQPGDVVVHSTDSAGTNAPWGELMSTVAKRNGAAGCVCDSQIRDCVKIIEIGFPVYYTGIRPLDSKGRAIVMSYDVPVKCGGILVTKDDIIFADYDGIVVVPEDLSEEVFKRSSEKINSENLSRKELFEGRSLRDVYEKYHAL